MTSTTANSFNHVAIWVSDLERSAQWYQEVLGLESLGQSGNHIFMRLANGEVLALFKASDTAQVGGGIHHLALAVADPEAALERLRERDIPLEQRGPSLSFQDPDGYWLHFC